ncbi:putative ABC transporter ATP-binding protein YxlF [Kiritimatiella glycovorans]|uniref:Putative ABC transporter ATP-binding protein YxlF n=2 Tax=Kiritimatiella glycovorans TaxID=1307763 RepID=A0A0G3EFG2_9BACT|nr:putative ABC transporter ATP-binding protein YxlF [Kiritimatiella glycovorans]
MIRVTNLVKRYPGGVTAVDDLSFEIGAGEIVAVLGPNGAGKTTTLRVLTGFLEATSGSVEIGGTEVGVHPAEVKRNIGYLPENCPLYPDMRVDEYLQFRAAIKGVPRRDRKRRLGEVRAQCGLADRGRAVIGRLSKGYRQRVGLADALIADPELLVLDEPSVGLDPAQMRELRHLISGLASRHTVLLSTHLLPEAEAVCERVLILQSGRLLLSEKTADLRRRLGTGTRITAELRAETAAVREACATIEHVTAAEVRMREDGWVRCELHAAGEEARLAVYRMAAARDWDLRELHREPLSLEEIFVDVTRRAAGETAGGVT